MLLGDSNPRVKREDIFEHTIGNERLHEVNNDNGVRDVNFATSKIKSVKSTMFPHRNIHKDIFSLRHCVHPGSGAHPSSYSTDIGVSSPGNKAAGVWS
jgi:hypothetical protein